MLTSGRVIGLSLERPANPPSTLPIRRGRPRRLMPAATLAWGGPEEEGSRKWSGRSVPTQMLPHADLERWTDQIGGQAIAPGKRSTFPSGRPG
jgi:hypothetical protein